MKFNLKNSIALILLGGCLTLGIGLVYAQDTDITEPVKTAIAIRIDNQAPKVNGVLDDEIWKKAPIHRGFLQSAPNEGIEATQKTTFQIAYDDEAIYFGILCHDDKPDEIVSRLTRRDGNVEADCVGIGLDPHFDHQTGFWFEVCVSGCVRDGTYSNDRMKDDTWNGVWEVETKIHDKGWTAEYKIPYHVLRFSPKEKYVWGLNVERNICRNNEEAQWMLNRKDSPGLVSKFGRLEGISGIDPPMHLELIPYAMGRTILNDENEYSGSIGTDIRYGITSSTSLYATINPDFGQVEADPASLNLTAFEDYFRERRPFFVEGAAIFQNGDYGLFHSRRIGRRPRYYDIPEDAEEIERPKETTILGAAKLTGKTRSKTTFGIMEAVTAPEYATIEKEVDGEAVQDEHLIEPLTNYFVGRVQQDVLSGTSKVGLIMTSINRRDADSAYVGALDWDLKFKKDIYNISGTLAGSRAGESDDRKSGYISHIEFDKRGGWLEAEIGASAISPNLNINDLGFSRRSDIIRSWSSFGLYRNSPIGPLNNFRVNGEGELAWNYDGLRLENGFSASTWAELKNYWGLHIHYGRDFAAMNDNDVRRGGPIIKTPADYFIHAMLRTDERKIVSFSIRPERRGSDDKDTYSHSLDLGMEIRPLPNVWLLLEPSYSHRVNNAQWVEAIEEVVNGEVTPHYVYGELDSQTLDFTTRARISFTPELSLELYLQPFIAIGDYRGFKELVKQETYEFKSYQLDEDRDFHRRSLKSNIVLRWEFQPGSTLFVVWSQSRSASLEELTEEDLEFRPFDRLRSSFSDDGSNVFLVKLNYWLGI